MEARPYRQQHCSGRLPFRKPVTALGVLRLVEDGKIDLDAEGKVKH